MAPQVWPTDTQKITSSLVTVAQALMLADQNGWITEEEAGDTFRFVSDQLGIKLSPHSEIERVSSPKTGVPGEDGAGFDSKYQRTIAELGQKFAAGARGRLPGEGPDHPATISGGNGAQESPALKSAGLNGVQITALRGIVQAVASDDMPMESALDMIEMAFPDVPREIAERMLQRAKDHIPASART